MVRETPCSEFNVQALVEHATGTQVSFAPMFGAPEAEGSDWPTARDAMAAALAVEGSLDGTTEHPAFGEVPKASMLGVATTDLLIHSWDLARSIGADEQLPGDSVQAALKGLQSLPAELRSALFATEVQVGPDASTQEQMLGLSGRQP